MNSEPLFPPHIRSFDAAVEFVAGWVDMIGGHITSELAVLDTGRTLRVAPTTVTFAGTATVLTFSFTLDADLVATWYRFDLRRSDDELLWRHDCHPGHEDIFGGPHHLHIGPDEGHRIAAQPVTLEQVATKIVSTHVNLSS
ncbi:MAG TPA: DUF6516 family protein [Acidimicrobiales bacterium]|nr:DUF6516 family protein [Acidimicrobiales bacterium]